MASCTESSEEESEVRLLPPKNSPNQIQTLVTAIHIRVSVFKLWRSLSPKIQFLNFDPNFSIPYCSFKVYT